MLTSDIQTLDNRHSGKYISNIMFDAHRFNQFSKGGVLNIMKDLLTVIFLVWLCFIKIGN